MDLGLTLKSHGPPPPPRHPPTFKHEGVLWYYPYFKIFLFRVVLSAFKLGILMRILFPATMKRAKFPHKFFDVSSLGFFSYHFSNFHIFRDSRWITLPNWPTIRIKVKYSSGQIMNTCTCWKKNSMMGTLHQGLHLDKYYFQKSQKQECYFCLLFSEKKHF